MATLRIVRTENGQDTIVGSGWDAKEGLANAYQSMLAVAWAEVNSVAELEQWHHSVNLSIEGRNMEITEECVRHPADNRHEARNIHFWLEQRPAPRGSTS